MSKTKAGMCPYTPDHTKQTIHSAYGDLSEIWNDALFGLYSNLQNRIDSGGKIIKKLCN